MRDFIAKEYTWFLGYYDRYRHNIQRVDSFRCFALYHFGGLYLDLDICVTQNFSFLFQMVDAEVYFPITPNFKTFTNCLMASKKGAPFWKTMFEVLVKRHNAFWKFGYLNIIFGTGPMALTKAVDSYQYPIGVLPGNIISQSINKPNQKDNTYTKALTGGSWHTPDAAVITFINQHWQLLVFNLLLLFIYFWWSFWWYRQCSLVF